MQHRLTIGHEPPIQATMESAMQTLNVIQAAAYTNLSKSSLDKLRVYGSGPLYIKVGARVVYDRIDLDTWLIGKKVAKPTK
jgi:predicted DNA-binding transcriptional regulator AlpA